MTTFSVTNQPVLSYAPISLQIPGRPAALEMRVSAPQSGKDLPIILLSHGHGGALNLSSMNGYTPLAQAWAAAGYVVIQPTHLSSRTQSQHWEGNPDAPFFWRSRAEDMSHIIDHLDEIEAATPLLAGRLNRDCIAVAGHSLGGFTSELLLGATVAEPEDGPRVSYFEPRIKQGILLAAPGRGEDTLNGWMAEKTPFFRTIDFSTMVTPALVVAGDKDDSQHFTDAGPSWHIDPYSLSPAPKALLTIFDGEHLLGGIQGYDAAETTDESPVRVAAIAAISAAYLDTQFHIDNDAWQRVQNELQSAGNAPGKVEVRTE